MSTHEELSDDDVLLPGLHWDPDAITPRDLPVRRVGYEMSLAEYCDFINSFPPDPRDVRRVVDYPHPFTLMD